MAQKDDLKLPIIPLGDKVLVELLLSQESAGGIVLPEKDGFYGYVRSISQGVPDTYIATRFKALCSRALEVGDKVYLPRGRKSGAEFPVGEGANRKVYSLVAIVNIGAISNT